jgi:hypothetical protein
MSGFELKHQLADRRRLIWIENASRWASRKLSTRSSACSAPSLVGDLTELIGEPVIDLGRGGQGAVASMLIRDQFRLGSAPS